MPKPRQFRPIIFISHSARNDPAAHTTLTKLQQYLHKNGFDVLLDETRLQGGDDWRNHLHTWMGHCHGAILLLNKKALDSKWVLKEATILSWRRSLSGGSFPLLPVLVGISATDLAESVSFNPLALTEIQALKNLTGAKLGTAVVELLASLRLREAKTPQRLLEEKIAEWLANLRRPALLNQVADALGEDLGGWDPNRDLASKIAMLLLQASSDKLIDGLQPLMGAMSKEGLLSIMNMLRGAWVNREMAGTLTLIARSAKGARAAALNAEEQEFTARSVISRATGSYPPWEFIRLSTAAGEDLAGSLKAQVRAEFEKMLGTKDPRRIEAYIKSKDTREPLFIVLPPPNTEQALPDDADVQALIDEYPSCTLFMLTGSSLPSEQRLKGVQQLRPGLGPDEEFAAYNIFNELARKIDAIH